MALWANAPLVHRRLHPSKNVTNTGCGPYDENSSSYFLEPLAKPPKQGNIAARMLQIVGFEGVGAATVKWHHQVYEDKMESAYQ